MKTKKRPIVFSAILALAMLLNCSGTLAPKSYNFHEEEKKALNDDQAEKLKKEIRKYYKAPFQWGGNSTAGTDCSGLVSAIYYNALGVVIPHNAGEMYTYCLPIDKSQLQFGDLVFFGKSSKPTHVGLYIVRKYFLDATKGKGVVLNNLEESYYKRQYVGSRRVQIN
jgi:murein DD-endopeptidase / murein LD-carboxypeptidase